VRYKCRLFDISGNPLKYLSLKLDATISSSNSKYTRFLDLIKFRIESNLKAFSILTADNDKKVKPAFDLQNFNIF